jgi:nifR3 family TIM-barrel protein
MTDRLVTWKIGDVPIRGDLILAPMDGITDYPFRGLCRDLGSAFVVTEFINALDVIENNPRYPKRLVFDPSQRPLSLQILGDQPGRMLEAAIQLVDRIQPDILDINLGCQSKNVTSRGAGAALLKTPEKIARIFSLMTHQFSIPVTGKIRLGWDEDSLNYLEVAKIIADNGGAMVAVHGRTRRQAYRGAARWEPIAEVKDLLQIPVIGNGDVRSVADIDAIKRQTGCDAVMVGRAAVSNPWIFQRLDREMVPVSTVHKTILAHFESMLAYYGERGVITFRKYLKSYLAPYPIAKDELQAILNTKDAETVRQRLEVLFSDLT